MRVIELTRGQVAYCDNSEYQILIQLNWCLDVHKGKLYARARNKGVLVKMHRFIMRVKDPKIYVDHRDSDGLDNQKKNLRKCTPQQNQYNKGVYKNNTTGSKGVVYHKRNKSWDIQISCDKKRLYLSGFKSKKFASQIYNELAYVLYGSFASFN